MATAKNVLCKAICDGVASGGGSQTVYFRSNSLLYTGSFATATGITVCTGTEKANTPTPVTNLVRGGFLYKAQVTIAGDSNDPPQQRTVLVANNKLSEFRAWASAGTNNLPGGPARPVIGGRLRMLRQSLS